MDKHDEESSKRAGAGVFLKHLETEKGADLVINCGGYRVKAHQLIVCELSDFFNKACSGPWTESTTGEITLADTTPMTLAMCLLFMYAGSYWSMLSSLRSINASVGNMIEKGEKVTQMQQLLYITSQMLVNDWLMLLSHILVYAAADKYQIKAGLKNEAARCFKSYLSGEFSRSDLASRSPTLIIQFVYTLIPEHDSTLREIVRKQLKKMNLKGLMDAPRFKDLVSEHGAFGLDVVEALSYSYVPSPGLRLLDTKQVFCQYCGVIDEDKADRYKGEWYCTACDLPVHVFMPSLFGRPAPNKRKRKRVE